MDKAGWFRQLNKNVKKPQWCPGCGDFSELKTLITALAELASEDEELHKNAELEEIKHLRSLNLSTKLCKSCPEIHFYPRYEPETVVIGSGIGCAGQMFGYVNAFGAKAPHGRALPLALGIKAVRPDLTVIPQGGDGDAFAIGAAHYVNSAKHNMDITYLVTNNEVYGLTKGQVSPTASRRLKTKANPEGSRCEPLNPIAIAISSGWTFVARLVNVGKLAGGFDTAKFSVEVMKEAIKHPGSSMVIFETECPNYNKIKTREWLKERTVPISELRPKYRPIRAEAGISLALIPAEEKIPIGIYYRIRKPTFQEENGIVEPLLNVRPDRIEVQKLMEEFS